MLTHTGFCCSTHLPPSPWGLALQPSSHTSYTQVGLPVGHSVESTRPVSLCSIKANIAVSGTTNSPGIPCWAPRETVCVPLLRTVSHPLAPQPQTPQVRPTGPATPLQIQGP